MSKGEQMKEYVCEVNLVFSGNNFEAKKQKGICRKSKKYL